VPRDRARYAMEILGLASKRDGIAATPSHCDQKLLDIALALVLNESTAGMGSWRMIDKVHELWEREKITVVEHDMDIVFKIAALIFVLCYGRILATATIADLKVNGNIRQRYLALQVSRPRAIVTDLRCRWLGLTD
jgi:branched-chain amino acid transport system ATP-binding protein